MEFFWATLFIVALLAPVLLVSSRILAILAVLAILALVLSVPSRVLAILFIVAILALVLLLVLADNFAVVIGALVRCLPSSVLTKVIVVAIRAMRPFMSYRSRVELEAFVVRAAEEQAHAANELAIAGLHRKLAKSITALPPAVVDKLYVFSEMLHFATGFVLILEYGLYASSVEIVQNTFCMIEAIANDGDLPADIQRINLIRRSGDSKETWVCEFYPCVHKGDGNISSDQTEVLKTMLKRFGEKEDSLIIGLAPDDKTIVPALRNSSDEVDGHLFENVSECTTATLRVGQVFLTDDALDAMERVFALRHEIAKFYREEDVEDDD